MKKFTMLFVMLATAWVVQAQVGTGVVILTDSPFEYTPTTVDSTTVFDFQLVNTVGVAQTVYFGGLDAPFALSESGPFDVPALDTLALSLNFTPSLIGSFSDTLEVIGNVFGSASLVVSGQGIQVVLDWTPADLSFETTAIGQNSSAVLTITSSGNGAGTISDVVFSNSIFSLDEANSTLSIDEGTSGDLTFLFSPTGAGVFNETVELYTNDPNNSVITIPLTATGISEVSGEVCDVVWALADSPFTLVGDVTVPEGCSLTIEPGVVIQMLGQKIQVDGGFVCSGTAENPVLAVGGVIQLGIGAPAVIEHLTFENSSESITYSSPYELVYYNNFESTAGQYDFDCYDEHNNYDVTGTASSYSSYGCNTFSRTSSSTNSLQENSGDYYLNFWSNGGGDGYLHLADTPVAPAAGEYEFSFTYESDRYEQGCFMTIDVRLNEEWLTLYKSPVDIEDNDSFTRFARAKQFFNAGDEMNFRIRHHNGASSANYDDLYTYLDEVRIERTRTEVNEVKWDFAQNQSDFESLVSYYGNYGGEPRVTWDDGVLGLNAAQTTISFNTASWSVAPIVVPADGWYYIEIDNRLISASWATNNYWNYKSSNDNNAWYHILENNPRYGLSDGAEPYEWRKEAIYSYEYLTAGSRIDFQYYGYYWSTAGAINWEGQDFRIYQLEESSSPFVLDSDLLSGLELNRSAEINEVTGTTLDFNASSLTMSNSSLESLSVLQGSIQLDNSIIPEFIVGASEGAGSDLIYYNNFESEGGQYDFDCYDEHNSYDVTGTASSYSSYGCNTFSRTSSSTNSLQENSGDYYLNFWSNGGGDGYLYLADTPVAPAAGEYEFSFTYESDRYEQGCFMTIDVELNGEWLTLYESPVDIEDNSDFTRFALAKQFFNAGDAMNFRIRHHNGADQGNSDDLYTYLDEVRIERTRTEVNEVKWDFAQNQSDFESLVSSYGNYGGEPRVTWDDGVLGLNAAQTNISFNTASWSVAPIVVPADGWYYIEIDNRLINASYATSNYWDYKSSNDNNTWYHILENNPIYGLSDGPEPYDWRKEAIYSYEYLTAGSRIDFRYYGEYWSTAGAINWEGQDFRIYQLVESQSGVGGVAITASECEFQSIFSSKSLSLALSNSNIMNAEGVGIDLRGTNTDLTMSHTKVMGHGSHGIDIESSTGLLNIENCVIAGNAGHGIESTIEGHLNYVTIAGNGGTGWIAASGEQNVANNSIFSNNSGSWTYVPLQQFNYISNYPQFQEGSYMLEAYSPCVDAAMPWNTDQNMPYGMGGLRADMGAYGGPNNAGWGGSPTPDGAATLQAASDSPQDQGYVLGLTFDASAFDNSIITDNISHYAVWRHYDPTGESIASLDNGNWELLGTMPAQGFSGYAYQAGALGNTNDFGTFTSCYSVVAHTDNEDVYWYSNVMCGEAIDNLAPADPELNGLVLESGIAQLSWPTPAEEDYAYTEIFSDAGFTAEVGTDTLVVDNTVLAGNSYTYTAVHYDVNGNASDAVSLTLDISAGLDVINLNAGWNLISIDRSLSDGDIETLFSGLQSGNLQYVTGFQNGVQFYNPNGLTFLNTMSDLDNGYGYWVKVAEDDVLEVGGSSLPMNYRPGLNAGWNLIGYPNTEDSDPADYFDDLIAEDNLVYVTGFNQGSQVFDPNGLAFLNTLQELENGFGYWVKTLVGEDLNGLATTDTKRNPSYMVLNGLSSLTAAGETVDVLNASGEVIAQMEILEGGFLMTTAVFGADPSDENAFGLELGEALSFAFNGRLADQTIEWQGGMEHRALNLTFGDAAEALTLAPNPAQDQTWLTFQLDRDAAVSVQVTDALGRVVMEQPLGTLVQGEQRHALSLLGMAPGVYEVAVMSDGSVAATARLLMQK